MGPVEIGFTGAQGEAVEFEGIDELLAQRGHDGLLNEWMTLRG